MFYAILITYLIFVCFPRPDKAPINQIPYPKVTDITGYHITLFRWSFLFRTRILFELLAKTDDLSPLENNSEL